LSAKRDVLLKVTQQIALPICLFVLSGFGTAATGKPAELRCDSLLTPLGVDDPRPLFSWQLEDDGYGAKQTAYELQVATESALLSSSKPDIWDSGRVLSEQSIGVAYGGPALQASKRYFWRVKVWDKDGTLYPASEVSWWETGLLESKSWRAKWIGYEVEEHRTLREANAAWLTNPGSDNYQDSGDTHHNFRFAFNAPANIKHSDLFVTGEDTAAAWINGKAVLEAKPLSPSHQSPWKTYTKVNVSSFVQAGDNLLAIDVIYYARKNASPNANHSRTAMSATLCLELSDGTFQTFKTGDRGWKAALNASGEWFASDFNFSSWTDAVPYTPPVGRSGSSELGHPWPTER